MEFTEETAASASASASASAASEAAAESASEAQSSIYKRPTVRSLHRNARLRLLSLLFILFFKNSQAHSRTSD